MHVIFAFFIPVPYVHLNVVYEYGPCVIETMVFVGIIGETKARANSRILV